MLELIFGDVATTVTLAVVTALLFVPIQMICARLKNRIARLSPLLGAAALMVIFGVLTLCLRGTVTLLMLGLTVFFAWLTLVCGVTLIVRGLVKKKR